MFFNNLCQQESRPILIWASYESYRAPCEVFDLNELQKSDNFLYLKEYSKNTCWPIYKEEKYIPPKLKKCKIWDINYDYNICCPAKEYDTYLLKKYLEKKWINNLEVLKKFYNLPEKQQFKILSEIAKQETLKEISIPVWQPLSTEQMWLLEATIFWTFVIVKSLFKL